MEKIILVYTLDKGMTFLRHEILSYNMAKAIKEAQGTLGKEAIITDLSINDYRTKTNLLVRTALLRC